MYLLFVKQLFSNDIMQAFCWTLVHSLWQGLILAFIAGFVILFTKKSSPVLRYNLFCILFILFIIVTCYTFVREFNRSSSQPAIESSILPGKQIQKVDGFSSITPVDNDSIHKTFAEKLIIYLNAKAPFIVMFWFVIFCFNCLKLSFNLAYIQRIRHHNIRAADPFWKKRIEELGDRLGIRKPILLWESRIIRVPVVVGFLKPVILVPLGLLSNLPSEQVEAILLHELAHIRRKDFFVNFIQRIVEAIFFFNPTVLWLSSLVRDERENCCDDMAIAESKSKTKFIDALVSFQEYNLKAFGYALTFPGRKNHILNRVKRIINSDNKTLNDMEKIFLATGLIIAGFLTVAFSTSDQSYKNRYIEIAKHQGVYANFSNINQTRQDTLPKENTGIIRNGGVTKYYGRGYEIVMENNNVTQLYLNGNRIPDDKIPAYKPDIEKVISEIIGMEEQHIWEARIRGNKPDIQAEQMEQELEKMKRMQAEKMKYHEEEMNAMQEDQMKIKEKLRNSRGKERGQLEEKLREMNEYQQKMEIMAEVSRYGERKEIEEYLRAMQENQMKIQEKLGAMQGGERREMEERLFELKKNQSILQEKLRAAKGKERKQMEEQIRAMQEDQMKIENHLRETQGNEREELENKLREMNEFQFMLELKLKDSQREENKRMEQKIQEIQAQNMEMQEQKSKAMNDGEQMKMEKKEMLKDFIRDLLNERIITDESNLSSFALTYTELIVNGKKQEPGIHKKFREKYIKKTGNGIFYGDIKVKGKGIFFNKEDLQ